VRMVDQNGGKFDCLQKIIKKLRFIQIENFFRRSSFFDIMGTLRSTLLNCGLSTITSPKTKAA